MKLPIIYAEQHVNGNENFIVRDPYDEETYSILYIKETNINVIFKSQDELYKFNYVGHGITRGYMDDNDLDKLLDNLPSNFNDYIEWVEDRGIDYEKL